MQHKYKLIAIYPDAIADSLGRVSVEDREALWTVQEEYDIRIILLCDRPADSVFPLARQLHMDENNGYIVSLGGSCVTHCRTGKQLANKSISMTQLRYIDEEFLDPDTNVIAFGEQTLYATLPNHPETVRLSQELNYPVELLALQGIQEQSLSFGKVLICGVNSAVVSILDKMLSCRFPQQLVCEVIGGGKLQLTPVGASPTGAVQFILDKLDLTAGELIVFGCERKHIELMQTAGLGIAMANASEDVKSCADYITLSVQESGIAHAIEKHITSPYEGVPIGLDEVNQLFANTLMSNLGICCTKLAKGYVEATMPVDLRTRQPFGVIHGGASLALAETVAGLGSVLLCEDGEMQVGMQVSGNHIASTPEGDTVRAQAHIIHKGRSTHVWSVEIFSTKSGKLICSCRVLNSILRKR
jgi:hypothetical protein